MRGLINKKLVICFKNKYIIIHGGVKALKL